MVANLTVRILDRQLAGGNPFMSSSPGLIELKHVSDASRVIDQPPTVPCCTEAQIPHSDTQNQLPKRRQARSFRENYTLR